MYTNTEKRDESAGIQFPGAVTAVAFDRAGKLVVSASEDQTLKVWDVAGGKELTPAMDVNAGPIYAAALSPDGRLILAGAEEPSLTLWSVPDRARIRELKGHKGPVFAVAFSSDGARAISGSKDGTLRIWDMNKARHVPLAWATSPWESLAVLLDDGSHDLQPLVLTGHEGPVLAVALSPDGRLALSGGKDRTARLWDLAAGKEVRQLTQLGGPVYAVAFTPDGKQALIAGYDSNRQVTEQPISKAPAGSLTLWEVATGAQVRSYGGHHGPVYAVAFSPDGKQFLSGGYDETVRLWDTITCQELESWHKPEARSGGSFLKPVTSVAFSRDGQYALLGSYDKMVRRWSLGNSAASRSQRAGLESAMAMLQTFSGHGATARLTAGGDHIVLGFKELDQAANSPEGRKYFSGKNGTLKGQFAQGADDKRFSLVRFKINCCAADAIPINVVIICQEPIRDVKPMQWVEVTGQIQFYKRSDKEEYVPVLMIPGRSAIVEVEPDNNPYLQ
jgi:hypothetical protein